MGREPRVTTGTMSVEQFNSIMGIKDKPELESFEGNKSGSLIDTLMEDKNYSVIRDYMEDRMGMTERNYDKREIVDAYINNMRKFNFGQSITTLEELAHLNKGNEQELEERRRKAGNAYKLFDSLGGAFSEGRTVGEKADAVYDYARALVWDPINVVSFGVGKMFAAGATKTATKIAKDAAIKSAKNAAKKMGTRKAATQSGRREIQEVAQKEFMKTLMKDSSYKAARQKAFKKELLGATGFDTLVAGRIDVAQQRSRIKADVQDEYDPVGGMLALAGGVTGGGLGLILEKTRGTQRLPIYSQLIDRSERLTLAARREATDLGVGKENLKANAKKLNQELSEFTNNAEGWAEQVREGLDLRLANKEIKGGEWDSLFDYELVHYFYFGDKANGQRGLRDILYDNGVGAWKPREKGDTFNLYMKDVYGLLDKKSKAEVQKLYDNIFNKFDNSFKGDTVDQFFSKFSSMSSDAGRILALSKHLNNLTYLVNKPLKEVNAEEAITKVVDSYNTKVKNFWGKGATIQNKLIQNLVTHPGTTALNLKGWLQATSLQSTSDMIRGTLYGGRSLWEDLMGNKLSAVEYRNKARLMVSLQTQKLNNLVDPYMTYETAMDLLTFRPEARKELYRYLVGGVEIEDVLKELDLDPTEKLTRTQLDKLMNTIQTAYGVKAQDFLMKTQEYMYALDKQVRLKYGETLQDFMNRDDAWEYISEGATDGFKEFLEIETRAVNEALENTFSKSYADNETTLGKVAGIIEESRNVPVVGALVPFGQFFNNTIAFMANHSGASLIYKGMTGTVKEGDAMTYATKAAAAYGILGLIMAKEKQNMDEGLAWHEERASDGSVISRQLDFPYSHYKLMGRILAYQAENDELSPELMKEFAKIAGPESLTRSIGEAGATATELFKSIIGGEMSEAKKHSMMLLGDSAAMYMSGFTRWADPANQLIAVSRGEEYVPRDRKQGARFLNDGLRYVDQVFEMLVDEKKLPPEKESATQQTAGAAPIGRIFGYRTSDAPNSIDILFNDVNRPEWYTGIYGTPESANLFKKFVFPILEYHADRVIEDGSWDSLPQDKKKKALGYLLQDAKKQAKESMRAQATDEPRKAVLIQDILSKDVPAAQRRKYFTYFGTSEESLWKLDVPQLNLLLSFFEDEGVVNKAIKDTVLP